MKNGWIKIHRKFTDWGWYQKSEMVHLFLHFLLLANHDSNEWEGLTIKKGQFVTGLKSLNKATGITNQTLRTCIERLKSTGEITSKSTNKFRLITIVNWDDYQDTAKKVTSKSTSKLTNNQQTTNKQLTANKNTKKVKNDKKVSKKKTFLQGKEWNELIDLFKPINPMFEDFYKNKTERRDLDHLAKKLTFEKLKALLEHLPEIIKKPYAPKITKPTELRRDFGKLKVFFEQDKEKKKSKGKKIIGLNRN